jgi:hypothetical protein
MKRVIGALIGSWLLTATVVSAAEPSATIKTAPAPMVVAGSECRSSCSVTFVSVGLSCSGGTTSRCYQRAQKEYIDCMAFCD